MIGTLKIFNPNDTVFTSLGNKALKPFSCIETKVIGESWSIDVECSVEYAEYIEQDYIVVATTKYGDQPFRIKNITIENEKISFTANHVGYDTKNYLVKSSTSTGKTASQCLSFLIGNTFDSTPFSVYSDIAGTKTITFENITLYEALLQSQEVYGGYLDFDGWQIRLTTTLGADRGIVIEYGKNLASAKVVEDWSNVCTKLVPIGKDGLKIPGESITASVTYPIPYTRSVNFDTDNVTQLQTLAQAYLNENQLPKVNYVVESTIQNVFINDTIVVKSDQFTLNANVLSYTYNMMTGLNEKVEFGNYRATVQSYFSSIQNRMTDIDNKVIAVGDITQQQTELINAAGEYGYCIKTENEMYFVDTLPKENATNVLRMNVAGIGFSTSGINGPYTTAWTIDGKFNADYIKSGTIEAARINGSAIDISANSSITNKVTSSQLATTLSNYSTITQTADKVSLEIGKIIVNGVNLLQKSSLYKDSGLFAANQNVTLSNPNGTYLRVYSNQATSTPGIIVNPFTLPNATYTVSMDIRGIGGNTNCVIALLGKSQYGINITSTFQRVSATFITDSSFQFLLIGFVNSAIGQGFEVKNIKVEAGENATQWTEYQGELFGANYTFDGTGATFTNGSLTIKNNAGTTVFNADTSGNLQMSGKINGGSAGGWTIGTNTITSADGTCKLDNTNNRIYLNTSAYLSAGSGVNDINTSGSIIPSTTNWNLGTSSLYWNTIYNATQYVRTGIYPNTTGTAMNGTSALRWAQIWCTQTSINSSSDKRLKTDIQEIENGKEFIYNLKPVQFKYIDGSRNHYGLIAQDVKEAMTNSGIDDCGVYLDPTINPDYTGNDDSEHYLGLRYSELIAPLIQTVQDLNQRVKELEEALSKLGGQHGQ